jgi:hypothetical protein
MKNDNFYLNTSYKGMFGTQWTIQTGISYGYSHNNIGLSQKEPRWKQETLFLKPLAEGKANLYQYADGNVVKYFVSTGDHATATQLVYKQYNIDSRVSTNAQFRRQLLDLMRSGIDDTEKFKDLKYEKNDLTGLFNEYNGTTKTAEAPHLNSSHTKASFNLKIKAGVNFSTLKSAEVLVSKKEYTFDAQPVVSVGLEAEIVLPFNNNKWSLYTDPNYQDYKKDVTYTNGENTNKWKADYKFIELPIGARHYMFLNSKSKLFLDFSYVVSFELGDGYIDHTVAFPHTVSHVAADISNSNNLAFGAGYSYGRYSAVLKYTTGHNIARNNSLWATKYSSVGIILGYRVF